MRINDVPNCNRGFGLNNHRFFLYFLLYINFYFIQNTKEEETRELEPQKSK